MDKTKLNYDLLLNDWADEILAKADEYKEKMEQSVVGSFDYGYYKGLHEATVASVSKLSFLETRKKIKYISNSNYTDNKE